MKKIFKIFFNFLSSLVIISIVLPLIISIFLSFPRVQNYLLRELSRFATEKVGSEVSVGRIAIDNLYNVRLFDIFVEDPMKTDTLLFARKAEVGITSLGIFGGPIAFDRVRVSQAKFYLRQYDNGLNIKYILDKIRKKDRTQKSDVKIEFATIELNSVDFGYRKKAPRPVEYGVNFQDLSLINIRTTLKDFTVDGDRIGMTVKQMSFREKGDFRLNDLSVDRIFLTADSMSYQGGRVAFERSSLQFRKVKLSYSEWNLSDFISRVNMEIDITKSFIDFRDIAKFTRKKQKWETNVAFSGTFSGTIADFGGKIRSINTNSTTLRRATYRIKGLPDTDQLAFDLSVDSLITNVSDIYYTTSDFSKKGLPAAKSVDVNKMLFINGYFRGKISDFKAFARMRPLTGAGNAVVNFSLSKKKDRTDANGNVRINAIDLSRYVKSDVVKQISAKIDLKGFLQGTNGEFKTVASIDSINLVDHIYRGISISGDVANKTFLGHVASTDRNLDFDFNGLLDLTEERPSYNFSLDLRNANLNDLGLFKRDSISNVQTRLLASGIGFDLDYLTLQASIENLKYINEYDTMTVSDRIDLSVRNSAVMKELEVRSDIADLTLKGVSGYKTIIQYIKESISTYLPVFTSPTTPAVAAAVRDTTIDVTNDYYVAKFKLKKSNQLIGILVPDLSLSEGTEMLFLFNPRLKSYSLNVNSSFISYKDNMISHLSVSSMNKSDSLSLFISADEILYGNMYFPNLSIINSISNDKLLFTMGYTNDKNDSRLLIKSQGEITRDEYDKIYLSARILPSYFRQGAKQWDLLGGGIVVGDGKTRINHMEIVSKKESFLLDGIISPSVTDTLKVKMSDFNIAPLSLLLSELNFSFEGNMSGSAQAVAITSQDHKEILGDLSVRGLKLNGAELGNPSIKADWNKESNQMELSMTENGKKQIDGYVSLKKKLYFIDFNMQNISPKIISPFLNGIAGNINGSVDADFSISNNNVYKDVMLNGAFDIKEISFDVDYTKVNYRTSGRMEVKNNNFSLLSATVHDSEGGTGDLGMRFAFAKGRPFTFNVDIKPREMLVLNTTQKDNSMFYGKAFATGNVVIRNGRYGVEMTADIATAKESSFFLPLSYNSNISEVDFVKFVRKDTLQQDHNRLWNLRKNRPARTSYGTFDMRLNMNVLPNALVEVVIDPLSGSVIQTRGSGNLNMHINPQEDIFTIYGEYVISRGGYRFIMPNFNLIDKYFTIQDGGWIRFAGNPLDARLNVDAVYKVKASVTPLLEGGAAAAGNAARKVNVDCIINLSDKLLKPNIKLGVEVPNTDPETSSIIRSALNSPEEISNQFIFLLLSNSFMQTNSTSGTGRSVGMMGAVTGIEFLSNQIRNILSTDKFDFSLNYQVQSNYTSDEVGIGISAPLVGNKLLLDAEGVINFKNNPDAEAFGNQHTLSGNVFLTWVLNESDNLRLKAFTRTIDTFDENQGLQQYGVGIYYKEEFNTFRELIDNYRKYFAERKKKKEEKKKQQIQKKAEKEKQKAEKEKQKALLREEERKQKKAGEKSAKTK